MTELCCLEITELGVKRLSYKDLPDINDDQLVVLRALN